MSERLDPHLEERLTRLAPQLTGADWLDVRRRAGAASPRHAHRRFAVALVAAVLALAAAVPALGLGDRVLDLLGVTQTTDDLPASDGAATPLPYVYGDVFYGLGEPRRLARPLRAPLTGESVPVAVLSPDGRYLAYQTAEDRTTPVLRVHELRTGDDRMLARGAQMLAWGSRGLAYVQADPPRYRERYAFAGRVVVRRTPDSEPVTWVSGRGMYSVLGWAGERLLIESHGCNLPSREDAAGSPGPFCRQQLPPGPYVVDGPDRARFLGSHRVAAVSPDGRLGFGALSPPLQDSPTRVAHVVDLASGEEVARLDLGRSANGRRVQLVAGDNRGAWAADRIALVSYVDQNRLALFRFRNGRLTFDEALRLRRDYFPGTFGPNFSRPVFADREGRRVVVAVSSEYRNGSTPRGIRAFLTCDLEAHRCRAGRPLRDGSSVSVVERARTR